MITALIGYNSSCMNSSNAQMNIIRNCNTMRNMLFGVNRNNVDCFMRQEKNLQIDNFQNQLMYTINEKLKDAYQKYLHKRIKESFSIKF